MYPVFKIKNDFFLTGKLPNQLYTTLSHSLLTFWVEFPIYHNKRYGARSPHGTVYTKVDTAYMSVSFRQFKAQYF